MKALKLNNSSSVKLPELGGDNYVVPHTEYFTFTVKIDSFLRGEVVEGFKLSDDRGNIFELNKVIWECEDGSCEAEFFSLGGIEVSLGEVILSPIFVEKVEYFSYYKMLKDCILPKYDNVKKGNYVCLDNFPVKEIYALEENRLVKKVGEIPDKYLGKDVISCLKYGTEISNEVKDRINNILGLYEGYIKIEKRTLDF